ncbi:MAG: hypothetical protein KKB03_03495, partial [Nanoarchaeota archaeon]|nr:hypothetical protein [Nanoarchaeota archaeon]
DSADICPGFDTCQSKTYDADKWENTCDTCFSSDEHWNIGGDILTCCGDDNNEYKKTRVCSGVCTTDPTDDACCDLDTDCVYDSTCYEDGYRGDVDADIEVEECLKGVWRKLGARFIPIPISPDVNGQTVNPEVNGKLDSFGALNFVWTRIEEADMYRVSIKYEGIILAEGDTAIKAVQPSVGDPSIPIPAPQMHKQADGTYSWKIEAHVPGECLPDGWCTHDNWYDFTKAMIPEITTQNVIIDSAGDKLGWDQIKHDAAAHGLGTEGFRNPDGPEFVIIRLKGVTEGTLCNFPDIFLPPYCYIPFGYRTSDMPPVGNNHGYYFEFDEDHFNPSSEKYVPKGIYEWSISIAEIGLDARSKLKPIDIKKTKFGPTATFTVV